MSSEVRDIEFSLVHGYTGFKDKINVTVGNPVKIWTPIYLPNDFIATLDLSNKERFFNCTQTAHTDVGVWYYIDKSFNFDSATIAFTYGGRTKSFNVPVPSEESEDDWQFAFIQLDLKSNVAGEDDWAVEDNIEIQVTLTAHREDTTVSPPLIFDCQDVESVPGRHLVKTIEFSPKAYQTDLSGAWLDPVCPYTHVHDPFSGEPANKWYGLLTTYALPSSVVLDGLTARVWSGSLSPKTLALPAGALDGTKCKIKWEGYDNSLPGPEPAEVPYCVFPEDIQTQPAPECVVAEGSYWYNMQAIDSRVITDPDWTLAQSYEILNIPTKVRYNLDAIEIPEP